MLKEFKQFIMRGNVIDLAVGVILGGAFNAIVASIVNDLIMPLISRLFSGMDFNSWFVSLNGTHYDTLAAAEAAGAPLLKYGSFISAIINFLIVAVCLFFIIKGINKMNDLLDRSSAKTEPATEESVCPFCKKEVDAAATRCPYCTSEIIPTSPIK